MSAGWEGSHGQSLVARHEWKGLSKMGGRLEDYVTKKTDESTERKSSRRLRRSQRLATQRQTPTRHLPGHYTLMEDSEDDEDYIE